MQNVFIDDDFDGNDDHIDALKDAVREMRDLLQKHHSGAIKMDAAVGMNAYQNSPWYPRVVKVLKETVEPEHES